VKDFGRMLPADQLTKATQYSQNADLSIVIGSSLTVTPSATLAVMAKKVVIVNLKPTPNDSKVKIKIKKFFSVNFLRLTCL
jgi:NAD-dependent deacetylase